MPIGLFELTRYLETCQDITASEGGAPSYPFITRGLLYAVLVTHYVLVLAASPMPAQTDIPSALSDDDKAFIFQFLDAWLNTAILYALLHGIYTGILAVSLWTIFVNKCWDIRRAAVIVLILLYTLITINAIGTWSDVRSAFIKNGQSFWTIYIYLQAGVQASWMIAVAASMSVILADLYMIWCCWMVWGKRWPVILLPISFLAASIVSRIMVTVYYEDATAKLFLTLHISFILVTTLSCTLLIIYRIISVAGVKREAISRLGLYRRLIGVLVESSAFYSTSLIIYLAFTIRSDLKVFYFDMIASIAKGVAPTLLVGRAAAGHTRPSDDYDIGIISSLHFQPPTRPGTTGSQLADSPVQNAVPTMDTEAQPERG